MGLGASSVQVRVRVDRIRVLGVLGHVDVGLGGYRTFGHGDWVGCLGLTILGLG